MQATSSNLRKYQNENPVVQYLIRRFFRKLVKHVSELQPRTVIDLGCGEGIVAGVLLKDLRGIQYLGYDKSPIAINEAERRNPTAVFKRADLLELDPIASPPDVVLCLEVLEHIDDTDQALKRIARLRAPSFIVSVPWEPFFRFGNLCRGQYVGRLGNHPEHIHSFGMRSLK